MGDVVSEIAGSWAWHVLHGVKGAFTCPPVGICVISSISVFVGEGGWYVSPSAVVKFDCFG